MVATSEISDALGSARVGLTTEWTRRILTPLMRLWRAAIKQTLAQVPRPLDAPHASASGQNSDRILIFGAGLSVGWGVSTHDLALPGFLARTMSALTGRGTDVDLVAHPDIHLSDALHRMNALPLWRYNAIAIVLGVNEALHLTPLKTWRRNLSTLLSTLRETVGVPIVVTGIQRIRSIPVYDSALGSVADAHAVALNLASAQICADAPHTTFVPLADFAFPAPNRHRSPDTFAEAARAMAAALHPALAVPKHRPDDPHRPLPHDEVRAEATRQAAVDALDFKNPELGRVIDQLLEITRRSLHAPVAAFSVLDRDKQVLRTNAWTPSADLLRAGSFCDTTIRQRGEMVVPDALQDERFCHNPLVVDAPHLRFYAGFPIESASGERVGALCVFDTEPRRAEDIDLSGLRDLALRVQRELQAAR